VAVPVARVADQVAHLRDHAQAAVALGQRGLGGGVVQRNQDLGIPVRVELLEREDVGLQVRGLARADVHQLLAGPHAVGQELRGAADERLVVGVRPADVSVQAKAACRVDEPVAAHRGEDIRPRRVIHPRSRRVDAA
jgi:hypothetical protein